MAKLTDINQTQNGDDVERDNESGTEELGEGKIDVRGNINGDSSNSPNNNSNKESSEYSALSMDKLDNIIFDTSKFGLMITDLLTEATYRDRIDYKTLNFYCKVVPNVDIYSKGWHELFMHGIPILDFYMAVYLRKVKKYEVTWTKSNKFDKLDFNQRTVQSSLLYLFFNLMTRGKATVSDDEKVSALLKGYFGLTDSNSTIVSYSTSNNISLIPAQWIQTISFKGFSNVFKQRLSLGIAGHRFLNIFTSYVPDEAMMKENGTTKVCEILIKLSKSGPFWGLHPLFKSEALSKYSFNNNVEAVIKLSFKEEVIAEMKVNKSIFELPKLRLTAIQWRTWTDELIEILLETKVILSDD